MSEPTTKERSINFSAWEVRATLAGLKTQFRRFANLNESLFQDKWPDLKATAIEAALKCSPFQVGDRLAVREAWCCRLDCLSPHVSVAKSLHYTHYRADAKEFSPDDEDNWHDYGRKWRSSATMPRWASRLKLEIAEVSVAQLQDMTGKDVAAEGMPFSRDIDVFKQHWNAANKKHPWSSSPWAWVVTYRCVENES